jgi:menaquinone-9 beta-reductase
MAEKLTRIGHRQTQTDTDRGSSLWDVVVVGGGPAGATAGGLLAGRGFRVVICEGKIFPREKVCGEFMGTRIRPVLRRLGLLEEFERRAGPEVVRVVACAGNGVEMVGEMPRDGEGAWPRAMGRGEFDWMLLERARELGAEIRQGCHVMKVEGDAAGGFVVKTSGGELRARAVVMAHGMATGEPLRKRYVSFKAHFVGCDLAEETIAIGGGAGIYVGLVKSSEKRYSLAFVVRRERLARLGNSGDEQLAGLLAENGGFRRMLGKASRVGAWMASGPLEPGIRRIYEDGKFFVGNAAGEVHALVGEGITLAMRGAEVLADVVRELGLGDLAGAGREYERRWRREFAWRYGAANVFANLMMRPALAGMAGSVMEAWPELLDVCIRRSGK